MHYLEDMSKISLATYWVECARIHNNGFCVAIGESVSFAFSDEIITHLCANTYFYNYMFNEVRASRA